MTIIFTLYEIVQNFLLKNKKVYVVFADMKKSFDSDNTNVLWPVLRKGGVEGKLYKAVRGIYDSAIACVRDNGSYSDFYDCPVGVKQGCLFSPLI